MKQTEVQIQKEIVRLFFELEAATYGREWASGQYICPNTSSFHKCTKRIYELTDELYDNYHPSYITRSSYNFIYDSKRVLLLELDVMKDKRKSKEIELTYKLEEYLTQLQGLFKNIIEYDYN